MVAAIKREPDPAKYVPIAALRDALSKRSEAAQAANAEGAERRVEDAMRDGQMTPAMHDWAVALCAQDPNSFDAFISSSAAPFAHLSKPSALANRHPNKPVATADPMAEAICSQLGLEPGRLD